MDSVSMIVLYSVPVIVAMMSSARGATLTFELADREEMCFSENITKPIKHNVEYKVVRGGNLDVDMKVLSPNGKMMYMGQKKKWDKFRIETSRGQFNFCFSNEFSTISHKIIYFHLSPDYPETLSAKIGVKHQAVPTLTEVLCENINRKIESVVNLQRDYRLKEAIGRGNAEQLGVGVLWWSIFQTGIILVTGMGQVVILKTFFTDRTPTRKP
ncbi:transmembrane emp24 domain-containing protein 7-like [Branchiostoma floridae x Branchiostoma japonicum]